MSAVKVEKAVSQFGITIKPCPFCGGKDIVFEQYEHTAGLRWKIVCFGCMAEIDPGWAQTKYPLIELWNRRAQYIKYTVYKEGYSIAKAGSKKGNNYIFENDCVKIELPMKYGTVMYAIIDYEDYEKVKSFPYTWHVSKDHKIDGYYYCAAVTYFPDENGIKKCSSISLHTFLTGTSGRKDVRADHIDRNPMNNRKANLRIVPSSANSKNRKGPNKNTVSGYRNVAFIDGKWSVQLQIDGKNKVLGRFDNVDEAGEFANAMRQKYYGEFAGCSQNTIKHITY